MAENGPVEGVYLSETLDLKTLFEASFAPHAGKVRLRNPHEIDNPEDIRFALCWRPGDDAFKPYPNMRVASSIAAGVDSIVNCPSLAENIMVTRIRDPHQGDLMAGFAAWHVIWHHRNMGFHVGHQADGQWARQPVGAFVPPNQCTVGVLGYGLMGKAIARAVAAMGFPVVAAIRTQPKEEAPAGISFETGPDAAQKVARQARILINVLPLTTATRDLLDRDFFALMPRGSTLIQLGRGEHLVEEDLTEALASGQLSGASVDVFRDEPLPPDHPWWSDPRIFITPHQASDASASLVAEQVSRTALDVVAGKMPETLVDRKNGY